MDTVEDYVSDRVKELKSEITRLKKLKTKSEQKLEKSKEGLTGLAILAKDSDDTADKDAIKAERKNYKKIKEEVNDYKKQIAEVEAQIKDPELIILKAKQFSNLLKTVADEMRKRNWTGKDQLFRMIFSNLYVNNKKEVFLICKPELEGLLTMDNVLFGGVTGTQTLDLRLAKAAL